MRLGNHVGYPGTLNHMSDEIASRARRKQRAETLSSNQKLFEGDIMVKSIQIFDVELHGEKKVLSETNSKEMHVIIEHHPEHKSRYGSVPKESYEMQLIDVDSATQAHGVFSVQKIQDLLHEMLILQDTDEIDEWVVFGYQPNRDELEEEKLIDPKADQQEFLDADERDEIKNWVLYNIPCSRETIVHWLLDNVYVVRSRRQTSTVEFKICLLLKELNLRKLMNQESDIMPSKKHIVAKEIKMFLSDAQSDTESDGYELRAPQTTDQFRAWESQQYVQDHSEGLGSYSAKLALKASKDKLEHALEERKKQQIINATRDAQLLASLHAKTVAAQDRSREQKEYKRSMEDAIEASDLAALQEASNLHMRVQSERERARLKRLKCPFKNHVLAGTWMKGPVLGPGPLPASALGSSMHNKSNRRGTTQQNNGLSHTSLSVGTQLSNSASEGKVRQNQERLSKKNSHSIRNSSGGIYGPPRSNRHDTFIKAFVSKMRQLARPDDLETSARTNSLNFSKVFQDLDVNEDGFVTKTDLRNALRRFNLQCGAEELNVLWRKLDPVKTGVVDRAAFVQFIFNYRRG